ncbi:hypothetical protein E0500_009480 [Streptomyces sp. KM273126]|uniref:hypothetical protein n=1 Tax=Streptomyces sp. KM273126 TaxID=2545247 RepID=UPI001040DF2C|nr:hypothetical protein [Streptomyces sp. KM273126]MBA2807636.1 hypothetical protein [Streptomyces sp. KM273126]
MKRTKRTAAVLLGTLAALGALATPAGAVPDPVATINCVLQTPGDVTAMVDPAAPAVPTELPGVTCLTP